VPTIAFSKIFSQTMHVLFFLSFFVVMSFLRVGRAWAGYCYVCCVNSSLQDHIVRRAVCSLDDSYDSKDPASRP